MQFKNHFYLTWIIMINNCLAGTSIPSDIPLCKAEDVECISKVATDLIKKNPKGRPDVGLIQLDPFTVKKLIIQPSNEGPVTMNLSFNDLQIKGLSKLEFERSVGFTKDPKTSKFEMYGHIPLLELKGKYKIGGRILVLPIQGEGNSNIELRDAKVSVKFKPYTYENKGKTFVAIDKLKVLLEPKGASFKFENLFNGDEALGKQMNTFLNENWQDVWVEVGSSVNDAVAEIIRSIMDPLFKKYPYDDIFQE